MSDLKPDEIKLIGKWISIDNKIEGDSICLRIKYLTTNCLEKISYSDDGWETLYQDTKDKRYWELSYPSGYLHGGGPPSLTCLSLEEVQKKYKI